MARIAWPCPIDQFAKTPTGSLREPGPFEDPFRIAALQLVVEVSGLSFARCVRFRAVRVDQRSKPRNRDTAVAVLGSLVAHHDGVVLPFG